MTPETDQSWPGRVRDFVQRNLFMVVLGVVIVAGLTVASIRSGGQGDGTDDTDSGLSSDAKDVCENSVKDKLKAPATAEFSDEQAALEGSTWTVTGSVDSENSFGALIRSTYSCEAVHEGGQNWRTRSTLTER